MSIERAMAAQAAEAAAVRRYDQGQAEGRGCRWTRFVTTFGTEHIWQHSISCESGFVAGRGRRCEQAS